MIRSHGRSATTPLLSVTGITKRFGGVEALAGCTLSVREGSITGLIGPNGAGKTTLFNVISGLTPADGGEIRLGEDRLDGLSAHAIARRGVARTFQIPRPLGRMSVLENVLVYAHAQPGEGLARVFTSPARVAAAEQRLRERAHAILESVELAPLAGDRDAETFTEVAWSGLHGLATLSQAGRLRPAFYDQRLAMLVDQLAAVRAARPRTGGP